MKITITISQDKIEKVSLADSGKLEFEWIGKKLKRAQDWLDEYFAGSQPDFIPPLLQSTPVWDALYKIPFGTTVSYKEFAKMVGKERAHRAVGTMIGKNPYPLILPCHRVIRTDGTLGGFAFGCDLKQKMLKFEKLTVN